MVFLFCSSVFRASSRSLLALTTLWHVAPSHELSTRHKNTLCVEWLHKIISDIWRMRRFLSHGISSCLWPFELVKFKLEMAKNPHCLSPVLFGFYQISGFVRFGFFPATEKWKFGSGSVLCAESSVLFCSVLCGFLSIIYLVYMFTTYIEYTVSVKKIHPRFSDILSQMVWNF